MSSWLKRIFRRGSQPAVDIQDEERARMVGAEEFEQLMDAGPHLAGVRTAAGWMRAVQASPIVRPIIERIATDVSMGEFFVTDLVDGKRVRLESGKSEAEKFVENCWNHGSGGTLQQLLQLFVCWLKSTGNIFALKDFSSTGKLRGLIPIPPHFVGSIERFRVLGTEHQVEVWLNVTLPDINKPVRIPLSDIFWHRQVNWTDPNGPGQAIVQCLNDEMHQDEQAAKFNSAFFANGCTPHMVVSVMQKDIDQAGMDKLKAKWKREYQGAVNAFRALFVKGDLKIERFQSSNRDAQLFEIRTHARDVALAAFQMPPEIMGIKHNSGKTSSGLADQLYNKQCIRPEMRALCLTFNHQLFRHFGTARLSFVDPVREAAQDVLQKTIQAWTNGLIPRRLACDLLGFPPPPEVLAGHYMVPGNMFLIDSEGKLVMATTTPTGTTAAPSPGGKTPSTSPPQLGNGTVNKGFPERYWNGFVALS